MNKAFKGVLRYPGSATAVRARKEGAGLVDPCHQSRKLAEAVKHPTGIKDAVVFPRELNGDRGYLGTILDDMSYQSRYIGTGLEKIRIGIIPVPTDKLPHTVDFDDTEGLGIDEDMKVGMPAVVSVGHLKGIDTTSDSSFPPGRGAKSAEVAGEELDGREEIVVVGNGEGDMIPEVTGAFR